MMDEYRRSIASVNAENGESDDIRSMINQDPGIGSSVDVNSCLFFNDCNLENLLIPSSIIFGVVLGFAIPGDPELSPNYRPISGVIGWVYFFSWTLSFYPQIYQNFRRRSSIGLASDKIIYDLLGYSCLSVYSIAFYGIGPVREMYAEINGGNTPRIDLNDVCFATHALLMTFIQIGQMAWYDGWKQFPSRLSCFGVAFAFTVIMVYLVCVVVSVPQDSDIFNLLQWLYFLSYIKIGITLIKYVPQVILNYSRKSTIGWNITGVIMDINGSLLSLLQLFLDCNDTHDWEGVTGNVVKLSLGGISLIFDVIFIVQHYVLYPVAYQYHIMPSSPIKQLLCDQKD